MNKVRPNRFRNILIAGLPGAGKSTFARAYAQLSRTEFVELDKYVERLAGKSIAEIFDKDGEAAFRELEAHCLERLLKRQRCTVALGGGTLTHPRSLQLARELGCIVLLNASPRDIAARLWEQRQSRPLLKDCESPEALEQRLEELWDGRKESYCSADLVLDTSHSSVDNLKIELAWLESQILSALVSSELDPAASLLRSIPLADPHYRSPREQRGGGEIVDKMERFLKSQKQKDRGDRNDRRDRKGHRSARSDSDESVRAESKPRALAGSRPRADGPEPRADGPKPRADGTKPRADGPKPRADGPKPRADGHKPRADGPKPRADGPMPRVDGPMPRADGPKPRADGPEPHSKSAREELTVQMSDRNEKLED